MNTIQVKKKTQRKHMGAGVSNQSREPARQGIINVINLQESDCQKVW